MGKIQVGLVGLGAMLGGTALAFGITVNLSGSGERETGDFQPPPLEWIGPEQPDASEAGSAADRSDDRPRAGAGETRPTWLAASWQDLLDTVEEPEASASLLPEWLGRRGTAPEPGGADGALRVGGNGLFGSGGGSRESRLAGFGGFAGSGSGGRAADAGRPAPADETGDPGPSAATVPSAPTAGTEDVAPDEPRGGPAGDEPGQAAIDPAAGDPSGREDAPLAAETQPQQTETESPVSETDPPVSETDPPADEIPEVAAGPVDELLEPDHDLAAMPPDEFLAELPSDDPIETIPPESEQPVVANPVHTPAADGGGPQPGDPTAPGGPEPAADEDGQEAAPLDTADVTGIPEPAGWALLLPGLAALAWRRLRRAG